MPPLSFRAKQAKVQRRDDGTQRFTNLKNEFTSLPSEENLINLSEFIESLIGEDDWCGTLYVLSIGDGEEEGDVKDTEDLEAALNSIEEDANFSIPFSQKADQKQQGMTKFEFIQRISIKSFLNYRVNFGYGKS